MAYAAVNSLRYTLVKLDNLNITQSEWDGELKSLIYTLERLDDHCYRGIDRSEISGLEAEIREAAWKLEDAIESLVDDKGVEQEILSFFITGKKFREEYWKALQNSEEEIISDDDVAADVSQTHDTSTTVGLSDLSEEIISGLLDGNSKIKMLSICGMAGIGKTRLARDICYCAPIAQHFEFILWVTIGSCYESIKNIFVDILAQIEGEPIDLFKEKEEHELRNLIRKRLRGRRYLVAFDDIWSPIVLFDCIDAFPCDRNERTILMTTRLLGVAEECNSNKIWHVPFLSDEESWNLFSRNVFGQKPIPSQLEKAGRKIAELCEGLPLLILTVADILRNLDQTEEYWDKVAEKRTRTFPDAYDRIYKVLVSSYDYLLQKYKAHFLYMGVFRQSKEIPTSKLIDLWNVEGLPGEDGQDLLKVFDSNSIAIICKHRSESDSIIKSCKLHSTYWYVCVTEARKINFFHVLNKLSDVPNESPRRLSVQNNILFGLKSVCESVSAITSLTRSLLFTGKDHQYPVHVCFNVMLLMKVLDALAIRFYEFPNEVLNLLQLKYLSLTHNGAVPSSISKLQRLQFLILRRHHIIIKLLQRDPTTYLPKEIWDLQKLQNLRIMGVNLQDPSPGVVLTNLLKLYVNPDSCTAGVFEGTPNLQKLGIEIELQPEGRAETLRCLEHTHHLSQVKSLKCVVVNPRLSSQIVAPSDHLSKLPRNLMKLSLNGLGYPWKYTSAIGSLPYLKVLKLRCCAFRGVEWKIQDGNFESLEYLLLEDMDMVHWTVEESLTKLRHLIVRHCFKLKTIPYNCFPNMNRIEVDECSPSIVEIVKQRNCNADVINYSWNL